MTRTIRFTCSVLWIAALVSGCSPPETKPTVDDIRVLTATLRHFLDMATSTDSSARVPILRTDIRTIPTLTTLLINPTNLPSKHILSDAQMAEVLSIDGHKLDTSLTRSLRKRNRTTVSLDVLCRQCPDFKVVPTEPFHASYADMQIAYPNANAFVRTSLPGYDRDGTSAVVQFWCGPSVHGTFAIYHLINSGKRWEVDWHVISGFL